MAYTDSNNEDQLGRETFAEYLEKELIWDSVYAGKEETFGSSGLLGRESKREAVLKRDLRTALENPKGMKNRKPARMNPGGISRFWQERCTTVSRLC